MGQDFVAMMVTHLNAPYAGVLQRKTLEDAIRSATYAGAPDLEREIAASMFVECEPRLIGCACYQLGVGLDHAEMLYRESLSSFGMPQVARWEEVMTGTGIEIAHDDR